MDKTLWCAVRDYDVQNGIEQVSVVKLELPEKYSIKNYILVLMQQGIFDFEKQRYYPPRSIVAIEWTGYEE